MDKQKIHLITSVNGNMNRFLTQLETELKDVEFDSMSQLEKELQSYAKDIVFDYMYFESVEIDKEKGELNE